MLPHVVCGRRVLDKREEEGKTLQTLTYVSICSTLDRDLMDVEPNRQMTTIVQDFGDNCISSANTFNVIKFTETLLYIHTS